MQIALPDLNSPAKLVLDREEQLSDERYLAFCEANPDLRIEKTSCGEIVIVPPAGGESDHRCIDAGSQLTSWSRMDRRGKSFGCSVQFMLPDGSALSPDAAWVSNHRVNSLTKEQRRQFLRLVPEFVIEVMSPSDQLRAAQSKMQQWIGNGVELGWLIDGDNKCVYVYRKTLDVLECRDISQIEGEGPVAGFILDLTEIWAGL